MRRLRGRWDQRGYITDGRPHLPSSCAAITLRNFDSQRRRAQQFEVLCALALLDRDGNKLGAWRVSADHMIISAHDELERVLARREVQHRRLLAIHQVNMLFVHWDRRALLGEGRIDD